MSQTNTAKAWAWALESAGLVQIKVDVGAVEIAVLLTPAEAHQLAADLRSSVVQIEDAAAR